MTDAHGMTDGANAARAALRRMGVPDDVGPAPAPTGCEVCDRTFEVDEAPWWTVQTNALCDEHRPAVTLRHAETALRGEPPRGIPRRQQEARDVLPALATWSPVADAALGVYLHGLVGRGKSYQAAALLKRAWMQWARHHGHPPTFRWWHVGKLLDRMRQSYGGKGATPDWMDELYHVDLLVLDDLGAEKVSDWTRETLTLVISERYDNGRVTIITSNFALGALAARLTPPGDEDDPVGQRIASRIAESCVRVEVEGPDRRLQGGSTT